MSAVVCAQCWPWGLKAPSQQPVPAGPCGVSGCLDWFFSPLWLRAAAVPTAPYRTSAHIAVRPYRDDLADTVFLGGKARAMLAVKVEQALGFQGGFGSVGTLCLESIRVL